MQDQINQLKASINNQITSASTLPALEELRVKFLGKKGEITELLKSLGKLPKEDRPAAGQMINEVRSLAEGLLEEAKAKLSAEQLAQALTQENIDVTLPGRRRAIGHLHPITTVLNEMKELFIGMGFTIADGPEVEEDYYCFEVLNIPANHPVKDEQDTFYTKDGHVLRTQTSSVQARVMENTDTLPIRIISPGKTFRSDDWDATHGPLFHQIEGLVVDENITMADLKGMLTLFAQKILGKDTAVRFRPSFFPFTEPSAEMDVQCYICGGNSDKHCPVCKDTGWVELLGCGMVHPKVLARCNINPEKYTGYAFGMGIDRIAMQRYSVNDMRLLFENDMQFLNQF